MAGTGNDGWRQPHRWIAIVLLVVLAATGLATFGFAANNAEAQDKAAELQAALTGAGLRAPTDTAVIARVLGTDGGAVCDDPGSAMRKAQADAALVNGAAHVGVRPVIAERNVVRGALVVLDVYCPDVAAEARATLEDYKVADVAPGE